MTTHSLLGTLTPVMVCHCEAVNDAAICSEIASGALDAETLTERCGAGGRCGGCHTAIAELLREFGLDGDPVAA